MNEMERLEQMHIGSLSIKGYVGPNLLRGLAVSALLHGALIGIFIVAGIFSTKRATAEEQIPAPPIVIDLGRPQKPDRPPVIVRPRPNKPTISTFVPVIDEPVVDTTKKKPDEKPGGGPIGMDTLSGDAGDDWGGGGGTIDQTVFIDDPIPDDTIFIPVEIFPQAIPGFCPQPKYPEIPKTAGMTGKVVVKVWVDRFGDVRKWKIVQASPPDFGFEEEVLKIIPKWKFTPAIQQGRSVGVWVAIPFKFTCSK